MRTKHLKILKPRLRLQKKLGWNAIESRFIDGKNIHDISDEAFEKVCETLDGSGVYINAFGSAIANWGKDVRDDFSITEAEINRAHPPNEETGCKICAHHELQSFGRR